MNRLPIRFAAALIGAACLVACGQQAVSAPPLPLDPGVEDAPIALDPALLLPPGERALRFDVHVQAALALAKAGEAGEAAGQLRAAMDGVDPGELPGLQALGFDPSVFDSAALALEAGASPDDAAISLDAVAAAVTELRQKAGLESPKEEIDWLMNQCVKQYQRGVSIDNQIVDFAAYQDAYGYAVVTRDVADRLDAKEAQDIQLELELLVRMWPEAGPVWDEAPAPVINLANQVNRVELQSAALE
ncbi:MAG: hypothetical protein R3B98_01700 [Hyphomonas sp.]